MSLPRRLLVVMNPSSCDFEARRRWPRLEPLLRANASVTLLETEPDDERTLVRASEAIATRRFDRVVAIGGDGTIHLVVNAIARTDLVNPPEFAVIPFGTANNVAKSLRLPSGDLERLAATAAGSDLADLDVGRVRTRLGATFAQKVWVNCLGVGMDADVLATRGKYRDLGGHLAYAAAIAERTLEQRSLDARLEVDGVRLDARVFNVVVANVPIYVGALELPGSRRDDGLLDVYLFDRVEYGSKLLSFAIKQADVLELGVSEYLEALTENQRRLHGRHVRIALSVPRRLQIDGECAGEVDELECEVAGRLRVAAPHPG